MYIKNDPRFTRGEAVTPILACHSVPGLSANMKRNSVRQFLQLTEVKESLIHELRLILICDFLLFESVIPSKTSVGLSVEPKMFFA